LTRKQHATHTTRSTRPTLKKRATFIKEEKSLFYVDRVFYVIISMVRVKRTSEPTRGAVVVHSTAAPAPARARNGCAARTAVSRAQFTLHAHAAEAFRGFTQATFY